MMPNMIHAHEIMPIHFIFWFAVVSTITELSGLFSATLPTLGRTISLDDSLESALELSLETSLEAPLESSLETAEEEEGLLLVTGFFELGAEVEF